MSTLARHARLAVVLPVAVALALSVACTRSESARGSEEALAVVAGMGFERTDDPSGTVALDPAGRVVGRFTDGSRTAVLEGPSREFTEQSLDETIEHAQWVRLLPEPWAADHATEEWFAEWWADSTDWTEPDALAIAFQYVASAPDYFDDGVRYRGDARFGPLDSDGSTRRIGGDFHDYLELDWEFPGGALRRAKSSEAGSVDCSGFIRLVFGYRMGIPLGLTADEPGSLPRTANEISAKGPGLHLARSRTEAREALAVLLPGDLVFFDTDKDGKRNHAGIYVGTDSRGGHRFISSRATINGPTIADEGGESLLDGDGFYARGFNAVRRL